MRLARGCAVLTVLSLALPAAASADRAPEEIPGQYIVTFNDSAGSADAATTSRERRDGFKARLRYERALKGFAAHLNARQVERLEADAAVESVTPDRVVHALAPVAAGETVPTGVRRFGAATTTVAHGASTAKVAVIDTGIDAAHPDLNVAGGKNCITPGAAPSDDNGQGRTEPARSPRATRARASSASRPARACSRRRSWTVPAAARAHRSSAASTGSPARAPTPTRPTTSPWRT